MQEERGMLMQQKQVIARGEEKKIVSARGTRIKFSKVPTANYSGVPWFNSFCVLSDEVVQMVEDNGKTNAVSLAEDKKPLKLRGISLSMYLGR